MGQYFYDCFTKEIKKERKSYPEGFNSSFAENKIKIKNIEELFLYIFFTDM